MNYEFAKLLDGSRWLMEPRAFRAMIKRAEAATPDAIQAAIKAYNPQAGPQMFGDVAVITAGGPITYKSSWFSMYFGGSSIEDMQTKLRAALADPAVKTILFRCDSPGGCVEMVPEFADEVFAARGQKPILGAADTMIASAMYWIASQFDTIYATTSSRLGAIGVFTEHDDISGMLEKAGIKVTLISHGAHKVDGNPYEPLPDDVRAEIQEDVDAVGDLFDNAVARGRGVTKKVVLDTFGQGDVFSGKEAIALGLADKHGTFSQVLAKLTKGRSAGGARPSAGAKAKKPTVVPIPSAEAVPTIVAKKKADDDPDEDILDPIDGECPDGYSLGDDGMCHLTDDADDSDDDNDESKKTAAIAAEHEAIQAVLGAKGETR